MKTPKRINSKRPSLWIDSTFTSVRIFYTNGNVETYNLYLDRWLHSVISSTNPKAAIKYLKKHHIFVGYL